MARMRTFGPRLLRPNLSPRYNYIRRFESTTVQRQPLQPTFLRRDRSRLIWTTLSLSLGFMAGSVTLHIMAPPPMPEPGSHEDRILLADLNKRIDEDFKVKVMRGKCLGVAKQLKGSSEGGWAEVVSLLIADGTKSKWEGDGMVNQMQGAKGLGVERLFWDRGEQKLVAVIWFGGALSGWPGVTHGGAIATMLADKAALAAALADDQSNASSVAATPQRLPGTGSHAKILAPAERHDDPAQLSLSYVKPTHANNFYVIRVSPSMELDQDPEHIVPSEPRGGHEFEATLETLDAKVCVKSKFKFAPSSALQRVELEVAQAAKTTYADFKQWIWPSRQASVQAG
ncbi:hypothetical protein LTR56_014026 [Elasticomyces elasticus]|nr:hypothetical protein LTR56_014026 [Elasticomyces elasticus]KAK3652047.1 hypothetical protein LTR22_011836 [Elasticomyces elasticus]KAK4912425.1 hypothetical protein LTR49_019142 [Elasticomyces elasticus]KAK5751666.1 hypothetical protein LTS12_018278 [Elasticomyces elasticus]